MRWDSVGQEAVNHFGFNILVTTLEGGLIQRLKGNENNIFLLSQHSHLHCDRETENGEISAIRDSQPSDRTTPDPLPQSKIVDWEELVDAPHTWQLQNSPRTNLCLVAWTERTKAGQWSRWNPERKLWMHSAFQGLLVDCYMCGLYNRHSHLFMWHSTLISSNGRDPTWRGRTLSFIYIYKTEFPTASCYICGLYNRLSLIYVTLDSHQHHHI